MLRFTSSSVWKLLKYIEISTLLQIGNLIFFLRSTRNRGFSTQAIHRTAWKQSFGPKPSSRQKLLRIKENIARLVATIEEDPEILIRLILCLKLGLNLWKIMLIPELKSADNIQRRHIARFGKVSRKFGFWQKKSS